MSVEVLNRQETAAYLKISRASFDRLRESGKFPKPSWITPRKPVWMVKDVDAYIKKGCK